MKVAIFSKLTLKENEIKNLFESHNKLKNVDLHIYDPIKRGDLQKPEMLNYDIIGIIDGCFLQNTAVGHREILNIIKKGIKVYGAGSMGALRASELDDFGMVGVGKVYNLYKSGALCDDDEVAVTFDKILNHNQNLSQKEQSEFEIVQVTFSMVSFREFMANALSDNIVTREEHDILIKNAKELYYPLRTYETVFEKSQISKETMDNLMNYIKSQKDMKMVDGFEMLNHIIKDISNFKK
ncbi:TfuA-like protein [Methanococcus voltae]|uniref:TfuA-like protein n=1 Tax=Methanococcus voltae TaxID=2188 RepID=UPI001AE10024|nr:TfuA-like protein [Methanococcus voltae]